MDESDPLFILYGEAKRRREWQRLCYEALLIEAVRCHPDAETEIRSKFCPLMWQNIVVYYYSEAGNFPHKMDAIYKALVDFSAKNTRLDTSVVIAILKAVGAAMSRVIPKLQRMQLRLDAKPGITEAVFDDIRIEVPAVIIRNLLYRNPDRAQLMRLILRYEIMGRCSGFFWSLDLDLYARFTSLDSATQSMPTLECFASPFNHYLPYFCSAFTEDETYGSAGNFFTHIHEISGPTRFIFNPPYTNRLINHGAKFLLNYLKANPGSEFVAMLPFWPSSRGIARLSAFPGSFTITLESRKYTIHDYGVNKAILGVKSALLIVNIGQSRELSMRYCLLARNFLRAKALELTRPKTRSVYIPPSRSNSSLHNVARPPIEYQKKLASSSSLPNVALTSKRYW